MVGRHRAIPQARTERLIVQDLDNELLVYDLDRHRAHSLNPAAALVWRHCDGHASVAELATRLEQELGLPPDEEVVWLALKRLQAAHLLSGRPLCEEGINPTRRTLVRRLGLVGGLALLLPAVESVLAPTPAYAASPVEDCTGIANCTICRRSENETGKCCGNSCRDDTAAHEVCDCPPPETQ